MRIFGRIGRLFIQTTITLKNLIQKYASNYLSRFLVRILFYTADYFHNSIIKEQYQIVHCFNNDNDIDKQIGITDLNEIHHGQLVITYLPYKQRIVGSVIEVKNGLV